MPLRVIGYDGISYRSQCLSDAKEYYPVITLVLNFSNTRWDKNKRLSECFHVPQELEPYFSGNTVLRLICKLSFAKILFFWCNILAVYNILVYYVYKSNL